ncbi:hypothetical protein [Sphingomonas sp. CROZ-RG-20F-R02-07]|uniref:hypothetical protein n=1 Tax=Sphingomonas sp. CROZ-RG-20F-R02-07 TaxID=2914832 RepID=UPI001F57107C|nr:hypothetical protein [Sphingomonas sp. CROZ-RG-20F-R02-07]
MSSDASTVALAALMDAVSLLRGEVAALARSHARVEETQLEMQRRLDVIDTGLAPINSLLPFQEAILANIVEGDATTHKWLRLLEPIMGKIADQTDHNRDAIGALHQDVLRTQEAADTGQRRTAGIASGLEIIAERLTSAIAESRKKQSADFKSTGELIAVTGAAVLGRPVPLPVHLEDNPMLERLVLSQPADLASTERALVDWQTAIASANAADLIALLKKQQTPSPTDTPESRLLRYRLAAITRAKIEERGAVPPARPTTTRATDRSAATGFERSQELAELWRKGESTELYAEPELAGAIDLFDAAERQLAPTEGGASPPELVTLHRDLAQRIETGSRPKIEESDLDARRARASAAEPSKDR